MNAANPVSDTLRILLASPKKLATKLGARGVVVHAQSSRSASRGSQLVISAALLPSMKSPRVDLISLIQASNAITWEKRSF